MGIFPEGTRNDNLGNFKSGVPKISTIANKEIIPLGIKGKYKKNKLVLHIWESINFKNIDKKNQDEYLRNTIKHLIK